MIIIDSNVWIFAENENADEHSIAAQKVQTAVKTAGFGIDPIIVSETFHALSRLLGASEAHKRVGHIVEHPVAEWLDYDQDAVLEALTLALRSKLRINDALIAQQGLEKRAPILTDNVRDFRKVRGLKVIALRQ